MTNINTSYTTATMRRITMKDLESTVYRINHLTGMPCQPYIDGKPQAGCFHLSGAYGGWQLHRMSMTPGCTGVSTPLYTGYCSKRELYDAMHSFISGLEFAS